MTLPPMASPRALRFMGLPLVSVISIPVSDLGGLGPLPLIWTKELASLLKTRIGIASIDH